MSNTQRPSLQRQHTRSTKAKQASELDQGYRLVVDGEVYEARVGEVTVPIARELRRGIGTGFVGLLQQLATDPDIDVVAAAIWVARRIRGEQIGLDDVEFGYGQLAGDGFEISTPGAEEHDLADPEI